MEHEQKRHVVIGFSGREHRNGGGWYVDAAFPSAEQAEEHVQTCRSRFPMTPFEICRGTVEDARRLCDGRNAAAGPAAPDTPPEETAAGETACHVVIGRSGLDRALGGGWYVDGVFATAGEAERRRRDCMRVTPAEPFEIHEATAAAARALCRRRNEGGARHGGLG